MGRLVFIALYLVFDSAEAAAHEIGLGDQILAPVTTLPSLLPLLAVSLLCRQHDHIAIDRTLALVLAAGAAGGLLGRESLALSGVLAALALTLVAGALVALARPLPRGLLTVFVLALGFAVGANLHIETVSWLDVTPALFAASFGTFAALLLVAETANPLPRDWHAIALRIAGSWVVAVAIIVLALAWRGLEMASVLKPA